MKVVDDVESVNFSSGQRTQRVVGKGESVLVSNRGSVDVARLGPRRDAIFGPRECEPSVEEIVDHANNILKGLKKMQATNVRCKMRCCRIIQHTTTQKEYHFSAVTADEVPENQRYHKYTPSGKIEIMVDNPGVGYEIGQCYYFDSTPAAG